MGKYLDLREMKQVRNLGYYTMRSFMTYTGHLVLFGQRNPTSNYRLDTWLG
jgi:hypothetical protein